jgi:hypothetical protein
MPRIQNPSVPAEVQARAAKITGTQASGHRFTALVALPALCLTVIGGGVFASVLLVFLLPALWVALVIAGVTYKRKQNQDFLAAHPDLTLDVPEYVRVAYLRFSADAKAISAADVPVSVRADVDAARETVEQLLVACHSERPEDPDEAQRIEEASTELMRLTDEADALHTSVRQRTEAIKARTDMVDGRDISEILAQARTRGLSAANDTVEAETRWLAEHLDAVREGDPLDPQD